MVYVPASEILRQFFVFNPDYGAKDGEEHKKLLFYYPKSDPLDVQIQNVGFCEAVVKFSDNFIDSDAAPFHEVNTEKELHVYSRFEKQFLVGAAFGKAAAVDRKYFLNAKALNNVLARAYETFRLFFGTFVDVLAKSDGVESLKERLDYFYTRYLMSLKLAAVPLLDTFEWISYMKVDPANYLKAQTMVERTLETFPMIGHFVFLYNDRLLLHNLSTENLPCLYRYLVQNLLPLSLRSELQPGADSNAAFSHGKFITGPSIDSGAGEPGGVKLPSVFLSRRDGRGLDEYYLIAYRALSATLAALVPVKESSSLDAEFFRKFDSVVGSPLNNLASNFVDLYGKDGEEAASGPHQYIYYNAVNLALITTIHEVAPSTSAQAIPAELSAVLCDFREKLAESEYFGDVITKGDGDHWVAAKKAGQRELYVVTYQKNASLTDVHEEIKRFCNSVFENVFLLE